MKRCTETDSAIMRCPDYPWKCEMCGAYKEPTNADHIRSMTDEELAELLVTKFSCFECPARILCNHSVGNTCDQLIGYWLKQPYKEDT